MLCSKSVFASLAILVLTQQTQCVCWALCIIPLIWKRRLNLMKETWLNWYQEHSPILIRIVQKLQPLGSIERSDCYCVSSYSFFKICWLSWCNASESPTEELPRSQKSYIAKRRSKTKSLDWDLSVHLIYNRYKNNRCQISLI